jgi:spermidine synthase
MRRFSLFASLMFILSGFAALVYQAVWTRYLGHVFGHSAVAQTVMLTLFMGGMGIGSWFVSKYDHKVKDPLKIYAWVELGIGIAAVLFHTVFVGFSNWLYQQLPELGGAALLAKSIFALIIVGPQCFLLGVTFPLLSKAVAERSNAGAGRLLSLLYFANSFGAAFGALGSIFFLVPKAGLPGALLVGGLISVVVALLALVTGKVFPAGQSMFEQPQIDEKETRISILALCWIAALSGACSFVYEIGWIRLLILAQGSSTYSFEVMLSAFILGLSMGAFVCRYMVNRVPDVLQFAGVVQVAKASAVFLGMAIYLQSFGWVAGVRASLVPSDTTFYAYLLGSSVFSIAIMFMPAFFAGFTLPLFTWLTLRIKNQAALIGRVYAFNTLGSIIGVIAAAHILIVTFGIKGMLIFAGLVDAALGVYLIWRANRASNVVRLSYVVASVLLLTAVFTQYRPELLASGSFRYNRTSLNENEEIVFYEDGKTATVVTVKRPDGSFTVLTNGKPDASLQTDLSKPFFSDETTMTVAAVLPLAARENFEHAAVIGWGSGMSTTLLAASPQVKKVTTIEIEPEMFNSAAPFKDFLEPGYSNPKSTLVFDDAKSYFNSSREKFDLILSEPSNPWVSGVANLFSDEFYALVKNKLSSQGVFVQWLQIYEFDDELASSVKRGLLRNFKHIDVYALTGSSDLIMLASDEPINALKLPTDEYVSGKMARVSIKSTADLYASWRGDRRMVEAYVTAQPAPINSDYFPFIELNAPRTMFKGTHSEMVFTRENVLVPFYELLDPVKGGIYLEASNESSSLISAQKNARQLTKVLAAGAAANGTRMAGAVALTSPTFCLETDAQALEYLLSNAGSLAASLTKEDAQVFWSAVKFCESRSVVRSYVEFFAAVAVRDHDKVLALADTLPKGTISTDRYVEQAAAVAAFAKGDCALVDARLKSGLPKWSTLSAQDRLFAQLLATCPAYQSAAR